MSLPQAIEDKESKKTRASLKKLYMLEVPRRSMVREGKGGDLQPSLYRLSVGIWIDVLRRHPLHPCGSAQFLRKAWMQGPFGNKTTVGHCELRTGPIYGVKRAEWTPQRIPEFRCREFFAKSWVKKRGTSFTALLESRTVEVPLVAATDDDPGGTLMDRGLIGCRTFVSKDSETKGG